MNGAQLRMARAALEWTAVEVATRAGVNPNTVRRIEKGYPALFDTIEKIRGTLENAGLAFIPENGGGAGVRFKEKGSGA